MEHKRIVIIGAGPSGLGCAYELARNGRASLVIDKNKDVGGLCSTINFHGYLFDVGGHRFLSKSEEINQLWRGILGDDMLRVRRLSRIYYRRKYFNYPISLFNALSNLGPFESFLCVASYLSARLFKRSADDTFDGWIKNRFGERLYRIFFKSYTEKVWGTSCEKISSDWAAQRIRGLSLKTALKKAFLGPGKAAPKTLSDEFFYPRTGPGEFYGRLKERSAYLGTEFLLEREAVSIRHDGKRVVSVRLARPDARPGEEISADYIFSSMPLPVLVESLDPLPPGEILAAARRLHFRSFLVVNIILDKRTVFPDQWIYVHSPDVRLGRIQNYKNWSPAMTADPAKTSLGLEYFCGEGDALWSMNDIDLINYAVGELERIGIASRRYLIDGFVIRQKSAYPVYDVGYKAHVDIIRGYLGRFSNLQTMGRQGLFRYDNSDHALLTGIYAARNFLKEASSDLWAVEIDKGSLDL